MRVVDFSMADATNAVYAWVAVDPVVSDAYRCLWRVDLTSPSIKCNLNILYGTIGDAVGLFQNITNATLITLDSTMSCRHKYNLA